MAGIILEGVTGAGKSQTLRALRAHPNFSQLLRQGEVFEEEETFGEFMAEVADTPPPSTVPYRRLAQVMNQLQTQRAQHPQQYGYVLERFHLSYYALAPHWPTYAAIDGQLHSLNCLVVFLHMPAAYFDRRSIDRVDRVDTDWTLGMIAHYGSRAHLQTALQDSQARRREGLELSQLPRLEIDTTGMDWAAYADRIAQAWEAAWRGESA